MKYLRSTTLGYKDIENRKSKFVAKTELLFYLIFFIFHTHLIFTHFKFIASELLTRLLAHDFCLNQIQGKKVPNRANVLKLCLCIKNLTKNYKKSKKFRAKITYAWKSCLLINIFWVSTGVIKVPILSFQIIKNLFTPPPYLAFPRTKVFNNVKFFIVSLFSTH